MKTGWKRCLTLLLALLVLQGGVPAYAAGERPASDYREDYAFLWDTLRENDPFLPHLQELGINADRLEEEYGELLETVTDDASFYLLLRALFAAMRNDCHLALLSPAAFFALRGYIEENPELYREKTRALLRDEKVLQAYESLTLPDRAAEPITLPPSVTYYSAEKSLVFHFPSFEAEGAVRDSALVREALLKYPEAAHIVFDITGNLGGSDAYWMDVIVNPFGGDYRYESEIYFMDSPLTRDCGYVEGATPLSDRALDAERTELLRSCGFTHCVSLTVANDPQKAEPLPEAGKNAGSSSLYAVLRERYNYYRDRIVRGFYRECFSRLDRQIVLVDCLKALRGGRETFYDINDAFDTLLSHFSYGNSSFLSRIFSPRIDRVLFAASKADHITNDQHQNLTALYCHISQFEIVD